MTADHTRDEAPPTVEERYAAAINTSNLRVHTDAKRGSAADVLMAMAWSPSRVGGSLMRLHSEWDSASKPHRVTQDAIEQFAATLDGTRDEKLSKARRIAHDWYMHECGILLGRLKSLPAAREQLTLWVRQQRIDDADQRVAEVIMWWLNHVCPVCEGRKKERITDTPSLSHRDCKSCHGTGETRIPRQPGSPRYEIESRKILRYISDCVAAQQNGAKKWLQAQGHRLHK